RKAAIEGIKAHVRQHLCNRQLLLWKIIDAWRLFAITKRSFVKFNDARFCCHRKSLLVARNSFVSTFSLRYGTGSLGKLYATERWKRKRLTSAFLFFFEQKKRSKHQPQSKQNQAKGNNQRNQKVLISLNSSPAQGTIKSDCT